MAESNLQRSVTTATARKLATTTKTAPGTSQRWYFPRKPHESRTP